MTDGLRNPYRLFFPLGAIIGVLGVVLWYFFEARWIAFYPRQAHGNLMYFGMLWPFVVGFLMTAVPRMTNSFGPSYLEAGLAVLLIFCQLILNLRNLSEASVFTFGAQALFLLVFIVRRFLVSRRIPFPGFIFLPLAFVQAEAGVVLYATGTVTRELALLLMGEAFLMNLVLGLGSRLIPMISRIAGSRPPSESQVGESWVIPVGVAAVLNLGYVLEVMGYSLPGQILRLLAILGATLLLLHLHRRPQVWSVVAGGFKIALVFLISGQILLLGGGGLAALHLVYIGGFGLITLLVSTRVVLAHGGQDLSCEIASVRLALMIASMALASAVRWSSGSAFNGPVTLAAGGVFLLGLGLWLWRFVAVQSAADPVDCR